MPKATCSVDGCTSPIQARGWCPKHYHRWRRTGDPADRQARNRYVASHGYVRVRAPGHPLAHPTQHYVYEHRLVLFELIGSGEHSCHWCGRRVSWTQGSPGNADALVVDHLDGDRANNAEANLVAACQKCNTNRVTIRRHAINRARRNAWRFAP